MMQTTNTLSPGTAAQLLGLGIPSHKQNYDDLRRMIPPFNGVEQIANIEHLAEIVLYLGRHRILSMETNSWKSLPWGAHACLFYKSDADLAEPFRNFFKEGLLSNEKCVWVVSKTYNFEKARELARELRAETKAGDEAFELIRHADWYENADGRFRSKNEIFLGWLNKIEAALCRDFKGLRVAGDAHFHPDDLKNFFDYEDSVNKSVGNLKIKALCTYCVPKFAADQISQILSTHQNAFGDLALSGR